MLKIGTFLCGLPWEGSDLWVPDNMEPKCAQHMLGITFFQSTEEGLMSRGSF